MPRTSMFVFLALTPLLAGFLDSRTLEGPNQLPSGCYRVVGAEGEWSISIGPIANGNSWSIRGASGTFENGQIRFGGDSFGTIEVVDLDHDGTGDVADLDFEGLPPGVPTHYTLEPCLESPRDFAAESRNPFELISEP